MGQYLLSVITLAMLLDVLELLSAERYKGLTRAAMSLILVMAILTPLPSLVKKMKGELDFSGIEESGGEDIRLSAFAEGVRGYISSELDLDPNEVAVEIIGFDKEERRCEKILITLSGKAALADYKRVERLIDGLGLGEAEVKIEI
jgi:hypothetical protein